jgi:hypothetical protein
VRRGPAVRDRIARLSAALVAVVTRRRRPYRKNGESLPARRAPAAPHPDPVVLVVMSLLAPSSVPHDGVAVAERTVPRQLCQTDPGYPGSALSSATDSAINRITAGVKACRWLPPSSSRRPAFTLLYAPVSNEKKMGASGKAPRVRAREDWPVQNRQARVCGGQDVSDARCTAKCNLQVRELK